MNSELFRHVFLQPPRGPVRARYLDDITLEQVKVWFGLARLFAHQSQNGVVAAGVHDGLAVLDGRHGEVLQLVLKEARVQER